VIRNFIDKFYKVGFVWYSMKKLGVFVFLFLLVFSVGFVSAGGGARDIIRNIGYENVRSVDGSICKADLFMDTCVWPDLVITNPWSDKKIDDIQTDLEGENLGSCWGGALVHQAAQYYPGSAARYYLRDVEIPCGTDNHTFYVKGTCSKGEYCWETEIHSITIEPEQSCGDGAIDIGENCTSCPEDFGILNCVSGSVCSLPGMKGYWGFDETSGITTFDSSGNENHGIGRRMVTINRTVGRVNGTLNLDGVDDYFEIKENVSLKLSKFSTVAWFNVDRLMQAGNESWVLLSKGEEVESGNANYNMQLINNPALFGVDRMKLACGFENATDKNHWLVYDVHNISYVNRWVHVACTLDGDDWKMYVDGQEVEATMVSGNQSATVEITSLGGTTPSLVTSPLYIGGAFASDADGSVSDNEVSSVFDGLLDEVSIWNKALTASEIEEIYDKGLVGVGYCDILAPEFAGNVTWADANFREFGNGETVDLDDSVRLVLKNPSFDAAQVDYEIWEVNGGSFWFDSEVSEVSGANVFWKANISSSSGYYFKAYVGDELIGTSNILKVSSSSDNDPMEVKILGPGCNASFDAGSSHSLSIEFYDEDDIITGNVSVGGVLISEVGNGLFEESYDFPNYGSLQIYAYGSNTRGVIKRDISNIMVINSALMKKYFAACIEAPEDYAGVENNPEWFSAATSRGIDYTSGSAVEIPLTDMFFTWAFKNDLEPRAAIRGSEPNSYQFWKTFLQTGETVNGPNWATLGVGPSA
jgi:hypothetical protein